MKPDMTAWLDRLSIRMRIALLTLMIMVPMAAIVVWQLVTDLVQVRDDAQDKVRLLAVAAADDLTRVLAQSEKLLARLAERPQVKALDPANCDPIGKDFAQLNPIYAALVIRDRARKLICAYTPITVDDLDRKIAPWFDVALKRGRFSATDVLVGPNTSTQVSVFTYPIHAGDGEVAGLLIMPVNLMELNRQLLSGTPPNAVVTVADPSRGVLLRSTDPLAYIGTRPLAGTEDPAQGALEGYMSTLGRDGIPRLFYFLTLPGVEWRVAASLPQTEVYARYDAQLKRTLAIGLGLLVLAGGAAWGLSEAILRPVSTLREAAARVAAGDETFRAALVGPPEIRAVAGQFNLMLDKRATSEARLRGIFDAAVDAIITTDQDQVIVQANPAAARMFRCGLDEMIGAPVERFIPARFRQVHRSLMSNFGHDQISSLSIMGQRELTALRADGEEFAVESTISYNLIDGQPLYTVIHRDISERKRVQDEFRASKVLLEAALSSMSDAVFITDMRGDLVQYNDAFVSFHRCADRSACVRDLHDFERAIELIEPSGAAVGLDRWPVMHALRGESGSAVEYRVRRKDSGETWIGSYSYSPVRSVGGEVVGTVLTARDITAIRLAQVDLQASHAALQRLIAAQDKVQEEERKRIAIELHDDLQQTLAAIRIKLGRIGGPQGADPASLAQLVGKIDALAGQALASTRRIVNDLRPQMLEDLGLVAALEMLARQFGERTGISCTVQANAELEDAMVDLPQLATCLYRVTQEALNNVVKHAGASSVDIRLSAVAPDWISLRITDDGSGMSVDDRRKSSSFGIAGMNERLRAQGGTLRIDSTPGAGTTLEALVPLRGRSAQNGAPSDHLDADDDRATRPAAGVRSCDG